MQFWHSEEIWRSFPELTAAAVLLTVYQVSRPSVLQIAAYWPGGTMQILRAFLTNKTFSSPTG